jgi:co-chaperonin GroES (HSP10)
MKNKNILVKEVKQEETVSAGGIILNSGEKYNRKAIVIHSASDDIAVGDTIIKTIGKGTTFNIDGEEYEILHEAHVLGIIE